MTAATSGGRPDVERSFLLRWMGGRPLSFPEPPEALLQADDTTFAPCLLFADFDFEDGVVTGLESIGSPQTPVLAHVAVGDWEFAVPSVFGHGGTGGWLVGFCSLYAFSCACE